MSKVYIVEEFDGESNSIISIFDNEKSAEKCKSYNEILDEMGNSFYVTEHEVKGSFNEKLDDITFYYNIDFYDKNDNTIGKNHNDIIYISVSKTRGQNVEEIEYQKAFDEFWTIVSVPYKENESESYREEIAKEKGLKLLKEWEKNNE